MKTIILIFSIVLGFACSNKIKSVPEIYYIRNTKYYRLDHSYPKLKSEWKELYYYLKKGHILQGIDSQGNPTYLYTQDFYDFLKQNGRQMCENEAINTIEKYVTIFGYPEEKIQVNDTTTALIYTEGLIYKSCSTCNHDGFYVKFNSKTGKRICKVLPLNKSTTQQ